MDEKQKICPLMTIGMHGLEFCAEDKCAWWIKATKILQVNDEGKNVYVDNGGWCAVCDNSTRGEQTWTQ